MDLMIFPDGGNFHARYQRKRQFSAGNFCPRGCNGLGGIVIGDRQRAHAHLMGAMDKLFRRKQAVRGLRVAV